MMYRVFTIMLIFSTIMILAYQDILSFLPVTIEGIVLDNKNKPVAKAYVYTSRGEEEDITDERGSFRFTSWQPLPVTLVVAGANGAEKRLIIRAAPARLSVILP